MLAFAALNFCGKLPVEGSSKIDNGNPSEGIFWGPGVRPCVTSPRMLCFKCSRIYSVPGMSKKGSVSLALIYYVTYSCKTLREAFLCSLFNVFPIQKENLGMWLPLHSKHSVSDGKNMAYRISQWKYCEISHSFLLYTQLVYYGLCSSVGVINVWNSVSFSYQ